MCYCKECGNGMFLEPMKKEGIFVSAKVAERDNGHTSKECIILMCKCCTYESTMTEQLSPEGIREFERSTAFDIHKKQYFDRCYHPLLDT